MKILYINIKSEQIQSNDELVVLNYDLDSDFFFYLGSKIARGCNVENVIALVTDFKNEDKEEYKKIIAQWNDLKAVLFSEDCKGHFEFTLPNGYIHWLEFHSQYVDIYHKNFSYGESVVISVDLEELYEESVEELQRKILRTLKRDGLYKEINQIVFNDVVVTCDSRFVNDILRVYKDIKFKQFNEMLKSRTFEHLESKKQSEIVDDEKKKNDDVDIVVNWLCDEFKKEKGGDLRNFWDEAELRKEVIKEISFYKKHNFATIKMLCEKCGANGILIYRTIFERRITNDLLDSLDLLDLSQPVELEPKEDRTWKYVRSLNNGFEVIKCNYLYGLVDFYGNVVAQCEYNEIMQLKSGNIRLQKKGKYGLINKDKTINIPCIYDYISDFEYGLAKVKINGEWFRINESGKRYL